MSYHRVPHQLQAVHGDALAELRVEAEQVLPQVVGKRKNTHEVVSSIHGSCGQKKGVNWVIVIHMTALLSHCFGNHPSLSITFG